MSPEYIDGRYSHSPCRSEAEMLRMSSVLFRLGFLYTTPETGL